MRLVVAVEKELAQLNQLEVDVEVAGDDDNEIGEGADGEMNEKRRHLLLPPRDCHAEVRACVFVCQDSRLDKRRVTNIADCYASKAEKHKNLKARLYCMRVDVAVIIHRTQAYGQTSV